MLKIICRLFCPRHSVFGIEYLHNDCPAVYICNHIESYAPIVMELYFPYEFQPWVIYNIAEPELCRDFLEMDFFKKELKMKYPFSRLFASILAPLCIRLMKSVEAIPVYNGKMKIKETFELSIEAISNGHNLVIFPEIQDKKFSEFINDFNSGFTHLSKIYLEKTGKTLNFYPVYIDKKKRNITIGKPIGLSANNEFSKEKENIRVYLRDSINEIAMMSKV